MLVSLVVLFGALIWTIGGAALYYYCRIRSTPDRWIRVATPVPPDVKGKWKYGLFELGNVFDCIRVCCCVEWAISENWFRSGWTQQVLGETQSPLCLFIGGGFGSYLLTILPCGLTITGTVMRNGSICATDGVCNGMPTHALRFDLQDWSGNLLTDFLTWLCCACCATVQEGRQVEAALDSLEAGGGQPLAPAPQVQMIQPPPALPTIQPAPVMPPPPTMPQAAMPLVAGGQTMTGAANP